MSLKPKQPRPMPEELRKLTHLFPENSVYRLVGDKLYEKYDEADYVDLYHAEGQPGLSPVLLTFVTVFQFLEKLADRQAANAVRVRLDWKYALHLPLVYEGFNFSVLSEFRDRVLQHGAEARLFDSVLAQLREMGLVKGRGRQRTDSLAVLTKVRDLTRLEQLVETLRLALVALLKEDKNWTMATVPPTWEEVYGKPCAHEKLTEAERESLVRRVGPDGQWLLERVQAEGAPAKLRELPEVQVLATTWQQKFKLVDGELVAQEPGPYDGKTYIVTPHDPEARYSEKRDKGWVGYKLQVTETDDEDKPHLITDIGITSSVETDYRALTPIQDRLEKRDVLPKEQVGDAGYVTEDNLVDSAKRGIDLIGPVQKDTQLQARMVDGITLEHFQVDFERLTALCPGGQRATLGTSKGKRLVFRFAEAACAACPLRPRCCTGAGGRHISLGWNHGVLQAARARQETKEFKAFYRQHRGGVEGCLSALVRGHGIRVGRYIGTAKIHLQALFTGTAANLRRAARWLAGERPQAKRQGLKLSQSA
ncbi:MAG: IS1182 family transposase [Chloroflexi bacterium]|nr:MAG: IS1182 family transposase [Chloroflexota bacterium]